MIIFKKLRLKNFRSYGNGFTEFDFENGFDLISSANGSGKSSLLHSFTYCLFGKIPKLKIGELINNINSTDMKVEVEFNKKNDNYKVIRGERKRVFEIYKNGELMDQESTTQAYQEKLEKEILGINLQSFQMLVNLDTTLLNKSFITMSDSERRHFLETVLDVKILYYINQIISTRLSVIKTHKTELEYKIKTRKEILKISQEKLDDIIRVNKDITENGNQIVKERELKVESLQEKLSKYDVAFEKINEAKLKMVSVQEISDKITKELNKMKKDYQVLEKEIMKLESVRDASVECSECGFVNSSEDISEERFDTLNDSKQTLRDDLISLKSNYDEQKEQYDRLLKISKEESRLLMNRKTTRDDYDLSVTELEKAKAFTLLPENTEEIIKLESEIGIFEGEYEDVCNKENKLKKIKQLVSDDGIKKKIFEKYIPIFNVYLNEFLVEFNLNYNIIFNEKFEISILDRSEKRSYYTFSASEKMRINLVIMFAFLKLIENRNGFSMNVLMIDELLDNALSPEVQELVLKFIKYKIEDKNKVIVSHNSSINVELFDRIFKIEKENGFSNLSRRE